jgi:hypothetical protein
MYMLKVHLIFKIVYSETKIKSNRINSPEKINQQSVPSSFCQHSPRVYTHDIDKINFCFSSSLLIIVEVDVTHTHTHTRGSSSIVVIFIFIFLFFSHFEFSYRSYLPVANRVVAAVSITAQA